MLEKLYSKFDFQRENASMKIKRNLETIFTIGWLESQMSGFEHFYTSDNCFYVEKILSIFIFDDYTAKIAMQKHANVSRNVLKFPG